MSGGNGQSGVRYVLVTPRYHLVTQWVGWWCGEWRLMARHQHHWEAVVLLLLLQLSHAGSTRWRAPGPRRASDTFHQMVTEGRQHCDGGAGPLHQARRPWLLFPENFPPRSGEKTAKTDFR